MYICIYLNSFSAASALARVCSLSSAACSASFAAVNAIVVVVVAVVVVVVAVVIDAANLLQTNDRVTTYANNVRACEKDLALACNVNDIDGGVEHDTLFDFVVRSTLSASARAINYVCCV